MKKTFAILAVAGLSTAAGAQSLEIEPAATSVTPGEMVTLTVFGDPGPADYAIAGINFRVDATGGAWARPRHHLDPFSGGNPGSIFGSSVIGISLGQLDPTFGFEPLPGRIRLWSASRSSLPRRAWRC